MPKRGTCYAVRNAAPATLGLLVVSAQRVNRLGEEVTAVPVRRVLDTPVDIEIGSGFVAVGRLVRVHILELEEPVLELDDTEQDAVDAALAELLLVKQLCAPEPRRPGTPDVDHAYPRWGRIYYAEAALGGQIKRWLVVSHNYFNASTGYAVCVRTTSQVHLQGPSLPFIQRGFALAVAPDVQTKPHARFDLLSADHLEQVTFEELRPVVIGLANHLQLISFTGLRPR
ncbi:MAG: hypothetical protein WKF42_05690 [Solirubrobacteraceae bacterium]